MTRINRKSDEKLYQPRIHSEQIRMLYRIREVTGIPMTVLVAQAIRQLLITYAAAFEQERHEEWTLRLPTER